MSEAFKLRQVLVSDEASFGEYITAPGSATWSKNLPILDATFEPLQDREPDASMQARLAVQSAGHYGARRGRLRLRVYWVGHLTDPTTTLTETWLQELLGDGLGGNSTTQVGSTVNGAATTTSIPVAAGTWLAGGIIRVGSKGDTRSDGQAIPISNAASPLAALVALPGAPSMPDVVRGTMMAYHVEGATLTTKRFAMLHATTSAQWIAFGAQLSAIKLSMPVGQKPTVELTYEFAYWERQAISYPNSTALSASYCAPIAGGSFCFQDVGTTTRTTKNAAEFELNISIPLEPQASIGGAGTFQWITGWQRVGVDVTGRFRAPWETAYETWWDTANQSLTNKQIMVTLNATAGRAVGVYLPSVFPSGPRPTIAESNRQNYVDMSFTATEGPTTTNDLTRSSFRLFAG